MKNSSKFKDENLDRLFCGILKLENLDECYAFFEDLCTIPELKEMSRRMTAAKMLRDNKVYSEIAELTGLSTATISRVNRSLKYGNDGYSVVFERLEGDKND
ncbi:MAG: TrpR-like protein, YerC/YecD [Clostridia bacterium]|nr:TrpR-like protein, YerC/YecD [Clostridia bacterium]